MPKVEVTMEARVPPEKVREALLDFSPRRPEIWPGIFPPLYEVYGVGETSADIREGSKAPGGVIWAKEHYDWSRPDTVTWTVRDSNFCAPGSYVSARLEPHGNGGSRIHITWERTPTSLAGRIATFVIVSTRGAPVAGSLRKGLQRLEAQANASADAGSNPKSSTDYAFQTVWRVAGTPKEVMDVLGDAGTLPRWWPSVYLNVEPVAASTPDGSGKAFSLHTKGWLPYTLTWQLSLTEPVTEQGFAIAAQGDLNGTGRWTFEQDGPETVVSYDWRVSAGKPLLRRLGWLLKPAFSANHRWAMARGQEALALELRRRRHGADPSTIPAPAGPTFVRRAKAHPRA